MAFEFYYCVSLSIVHPTIDPRKITEAIPSLHPRIEVMAGTERRGRDGKPLIPRRAAAVSHWLADLHQEEKLYSGAKPMSDYVLERLTELEKHRSLFAHLREEGEVVLRIGWFSVSNHSAEALKAATLRKCGDLGIDMELNFYGPNDELAPDANGVEDQKERHGALQ